MRKAQCNDCSLNVSVRGCESPKGFLSYISLYGVRSVLQQFSNSQDEGLSLLHLLYLVNRLLLEELPTNIDKHNRSRNSGRHERVDGVATIEINERALVLM